MLAIIVQMYATLQPSSTAVADTDTILLLFALLTHLMSWCFITFFSIATDSNPTNNKLVWATRTFTLLGTSAWLALILCCTYATGSFGLFVASLLVIVLLVVVMLAVVAMV